MAKGEDEKPEHTAAEKGKGKAVDPKAVNGEEPKKDKDGNPIPSGKDKGKPDEGEPIATSTAKSRKYIQSGPSD